MPTIPDGLLTIGGMRQHYRLVSNGSRGGADGDNDNFTQKHNPGDEQLRRPKYGPPRVVKTDKYYYPRLQKFYEWEQFLDWVDWRGRENTRTSHRTDYDWRNRTMTDDFPAAMNLARFGWSDALWRIHDLEKIDLPLCPTLLQSYDIHTEYNIAGGAVNIGRYLAGMPDCMRAMRISNAHTLPTRIQKILIANDPCVEDSNLNIMQDGYAIYQIIEAMERANIRTELTWVSAPNKFYWALNEHDFYECYIKLKRAGEPIYPERLLFQLAHPAMKWRLVISERERNPFKIRFKYFDENCLGTKIEGWRPPADMMRDTLVIYSGCVQEAVFAAAAMINSQYDKIR